MAELLHTSHELTFGFVQVFFKCVFKCVVISMNDHHSDSGTVIHFPK